jgi:hypothetical protein
MAKPKNGEKAYDDAVRVLCTKEFHARYRAMCKAMGFNKSEHVRTNMEAELHLFEDSQK